MTLPRPPRRIASCCAPRPLLSRFRHAWQADTAPQREGRRPQQFLLGEELAQYLKVCLAVMAASVSLAEVADGTLDSVAGNQNCYKLTYLYF